MRDWIAAHEIVIRFVYDIPEDKKRKYAEENYDAIQKWILSLRDAELIALLAPIPTGKGKAIKRVGKIIIDFLAQIEDFQKKLWLKKKFVVETNWCFTLDKIDESFWAEIIANKSQIEEWITMYAIDEADGWSNPPTVNFLRQNQNLIVDT